MATTLGTKLGTMLGTELADFADPGPPAPLPPISALLPRLRYRTSQAVSSGGLLVSIPNEGAAGGNLSVVAGTLVAPVADPLFNNTPTVVFSGTQELAASLPAAAFAFLSNGSPSTWYAVVAGPAGAGAFSIGTFAVGTTQVGARINVQFNGTNHLVANATATLPANTNITGYVGGTATVVRAIADAAGSPQRSQARLGVVVSSGTFASAPSASAPTFTLTAGRIPGGGAFNAGGKLAEILAFDRALSVAELAAVDAEMFATYGAHA